MAVGKGREFWEPHVDRLKTSGQSVAAYAREHQLSSHALGWWKRRLRLGAQTPLSKPVKHLPPPAPFVAVQVAAPVGAGPVATLRLAGGISLELTQWPDVKWLAALSQAGAGAR